MPIISRLSFPKMSTRLCAHCGSPRCLSFHKKLALVLSERGVFCSYTVLPCRACVACLWCVGFQNMSACWSFRKENDKNIYQRHLLLKMQKKMQPLGSTRVVQKSVCHVVHQKGMWRHSIGVVKQQTVQAAISTKPRRVVS